MTRKCAACGKGMETDQIDVRQMARRRYNQRHDNTRTERAARRRNRLNEMARELGFDGLSQMLTKWKNGEIILTIEENTQ